MQLVIKCFSEAIAAKGAEVLKARGADVKVDFQNIELDALAATNAEIQIVALWAKEAEMPLELHPTPGHTVDFKEAIISFSKEMIEDLASPRRFSLTLLLEAIGEKHAYALEVRKKAIELTELIGEKAYDFSSTKEMLGSAAYNLKKILSHQAEEKEKLQRDIASSKKEIELERASYAALMERCEQAEKKLQKMREILALEENEEYQWSEDESGVSVEFPDSVSIG